MYVRVRARADRPCRRESGDNLSLSLALVCATICAPSSLSQESVRAVAALRVSPNVIFFSEMATGSLRLGHRKHTWTLCPAIISGAPLWQCAGGDGHALYLYNTHAQERHGGASASSRITAPPPHCLDTANLLRALCCCCLLRCAASGYRLS